MHLPAGQARVRPQGNCPVQAGLVGSQPDRVEMGAFSHETSIMQVVSHPLLLEFKECIQTKTHMYIVTELVKGVNLQKYVTDKGHLSEKEGAQLCQQLIVGTRYLHSLDIVHRDLKPENIMVQQPPRRQCPAKEDSPKTSKSSTSDSAITSADCET